MPRKKWTHPKLGVFRFNDEFGYQQWEGVVEIPAFSIFRFRETGPFRGSKQIPVEFCSNDEDFVPSNKLASLVSKIIKNQKKLTEKIKSEFFSELLGHTSKTNIWWCNSRDAREICGKVLLKRLKREKIESPDDIEILLGEASVTIWGPSFKPVAAIGFGSAFEIEHGLEVITDGTKILGLGSHGDASCRDTGQEKDTSDAALLKELDGEELWSLYACKSRAVQKAAIERAEKQLDLILQESKPTRRKTLFSQLVQLLTVASESTSAKYESLFASCLENWELFGKQSSKEFSDVHESLLTLIGLGPRKRVAHLVDARDRLPAANFGIIADAARKWMNPSGFFDTFSPYLKSNARKKSAALIRHECLCESLSRELSPLWRYVEFCEGKTEKRRLDKRWLDLAVKQNESWLIIELASRNNKKSMDFLEKAWQANKKKDPFETFEIVEAMARSKHPIAKEVLLAMVDKKALRKKFDPDWQRWLYLLKFFPKSVANEIEQLPAHKKCNREAKREIVHYLSIPFEKYFE